MKVLCTLLCAAFASGFYIDNNETHEEKVVGGYHASIEDVPYQANVLWFRTDDLCGAAIIHQSWVITAAHCIKNTLLISVRTGSGYRKSSGGIHRVEKMIMHGDYNTNSKNDDIALMKLANPIQFNNEQQPIKLAKPHNIPRQGEFMRISGFGSEGEYLSKSDVLKVAYVPVMNHENCVEAYRLSDPITDNMFCAGNGDADACYGDSGGPGVIHGKLYGIVSFGQICGSTIFPGVYTKVYKYYHWIEEKSGLRF